ncbi:MAG: hypothetical protein WAW39_15895 [Prosthecobacter sp.]|uniref:hypothetical protein n=1 Tax=Prosthecobacter sp. TaxID=1965333 RepID=UPI003BAF4D37
MKALIEGSSELPPPAMPHQDKYVWFVWQHFRNKQPQWYATCWGAPTVNEALKLREEPLYHTEFHSGVPQKLMRERTSYEPCEDVLEMPEGSYIGHTNGVPNSFAYIGIGYGYRITWITGRAAWVEAFPDDYTATVRLFNPSAPNEDSVVVSMSLEEFVINMPEASPKP